MRFKLIFDDGELTFSTYDSNLGKRWYNCLVEQVERDSSIKEPERIYGFNNWDEKTIVNELNSVIDVLKVVEHRAYVGMSQQQLNILHHYFENLRGSVLSPGEFWNSASEEQKKALEKFNVIIHRAENFYNNVKDKPRFVCTFKNRWRYHLIEDDYNLFTMDKKFGEVYINYCEVGKPLYDVLKDKDDVVGEDNIRPLRYYSPDFTTHFYNNSNDGFLKEMSKWWKENNQFLSDLGFKENDPKNAIGLIPIAMLEYTNKDDIIELILKQKQLLRVELV